MRFPFQVQAQTGRPAGRGGGRSLAGGVAPSGIFPCAPGGPNDWIYVFARPREHWHRLLKVLGREELIGDPRYETPAARGERLAEVDAMVATGPGGATSTRRCRIIGAAGVPAGAVLDTRS